MSWKLDVQDNALSLLLSETHREVIQHSLRISNLDTKLSLPWLRCISVLLGCRADLWFFLRFTDFFSPLKKIYLKFPVTSWWGWMFHVLEEPFLSYKFLKEHTEQESPTKEQTTVPWFNPQGPPFKKQSILWTCSIVAWTCNSLERWEGYFSFQRSKWFWEVVIPFSLLIKLVLLRDDTKHLSQRLYLSPAWVAWGKKGSLTGNRGSSGLGGSWRGSVLGEEKRARRRERSEKP